jgi:hypothetical protein
MPLIENLYGRVEDRKTSKSDVDQKAKRSGWVPLFILAPIALAIFAVAPAALANATFTGKIQAINYTASSSDPVSIQIFDSPSGNYYNIGVRSSALAAQLPILTAALDNHLTIILTIDNFNQIFSLSVRNP